MIEGAADILHDFVMSSGAYEGISASGAAWYATKILGARFHVAEPEILKHPSIIFHYARDVAGPFNEAAQAYAENIEDPKWFTFAKRYVNDITFKSDPVIEEAVLEAYKYRSQKLIDYAQAARHRVPAFEPHINDPGQIYEYASQVIRGPWPQKEYILATDPRWSYRYAFMTDKRFPAGEAVILSESDGTEAFKYARDIIRGPWPEAEELIKEDGYFWEKYMEIMY